jgi:O-antigen/teichoic acid export membrane protein
MTQILSGSTPDQTAPSVPPSIESLDRSLVGGVAWTAVAKWSSQVFSWASLIILAHLLSPSDFGLVGMAAIYLGLVSLISEFGVGTAILALRDLTEPQIAQLNSVSILVGAASFLISCLIAIPLGLFFRNPKLPAVVVAMSLTFVILAARSVPYGLLQKEMRFRLLSVLETTQSLSQVAITLLLAVLGFDYWALVWGSVAGSAILTILTALYKRHGFAKPRLESIDRALRFTGHILVSRLCWYAYSNADFLIAGRVLGTAPLGEYTFAWNLATAPVEKISGVVVQVTPAFFSAVQDRHESLRRYLRILTEGLCMLTFPATFGLALVAPEFVPLALGAKWMQAIVPLQLLSFYGSLRGIITLLPQVLNVVGETRFGMHTSILALIVMPTAFYIGSRWGTTGIAAAWIIAYPFVIFPLYSRVLSKIQLSTKEYMRGVIPPLNASLTMTIIVVLLKWSMPSSWPLSLRFSLEVVAGAAAYIFVMTVFYGTRIRSLWAVATALLRKES